MKTDSLIRTFENALENIKSALNSGMDKNDILHSIGDEVSWALSQREAVTKTRPPIYSTLIEEIHDIVFPSDMTTWTAYAAWIEMRKRCVTLIHKHMGDASTRKDEDGKKDIDL